MQNLLDQVNKAATSPGVYLFVSQENVVLYVGKSTNIRERLKNHLSSSGDKTRAFVAQTSQIKSISVVSELEALLLEAELIKKHLPKYNSAAKDDKKPLYIKITKEEYPKILTARRDEGGGISPFAKSNLASEGFRSQRVGASYFGPFPSSRTVKSVLKQIRRIIPFCQQRKITKRGCLYSHIGLCNPCPSEIVKVTSDKHSLRSKDHSAKEKLKREYKKNIKNIVSLLSGKHKSLRQEMVREMERASKSENFEQASLIRDRIKNLDYITAPYKSPREYLENPNLLEDIRTEELNQLYGILKPNINHLLKIKRIECFDVSHTGGKETTASMVTFIDGEPDKNYYRRFKIRNTLASNDTENIKEAVARRLAHLDDWGKSDLMIIDGGKGQISAVKEAMLETGIDIPYIALAKRLEEIIIPKKSNESSGYTILRLNQSSPALHLLQRIRDEAHRFARKYHFHLRVKALVER